MAHRRILSFCVLASALLCSAVLIAQEVAPAVRIVDRVDERSLVTLRGNTNPAANAQNDKGRVSSDLPMTGLVMVLSRSPEQQAAFDKFVASQYDSASPNFHHWLEPDEVGQMFGPATSDIAAITAWLTGQGFTVDELSKDHMSIRFSGTAALVETAFHTEIHNLEVKGEQHIGNMTDPQIPAALAPAVVGIKALHNFFARPLHRLGSQVTLDPKTNRWLRVPGAPATATPLGAAAKPAGVRPEFGVSVGGSNPFLVEDVAPYDFAAIYNVLPLWNAGIDGTGQTIAVAGTSSIDLADVASFRNIFGLPSTTPVPQIISGNASPLTVCTSTTSTVCGINDLVENSLDVEWAGAVAKNAQIVLVASYPTSVTDDGLFDSENYIISHNTAKIMNVSYGYCELGMGTTGNTAYFNLWQTAASHGIAVFVASGDSGAAGCDAGYDTSVPYAAQFGLSVSGYSSTPYNTAVGGTDFTWCAPTANTLCSTAAPYWNTTNSATTGASAKGYVPETPWNDTCASPQSVAYLSSIATYVGVTGVTDGESACNFVLNNYVAIRNQYGLDLSDFIDITGAGGGKSACTISTGGLVSSCSGGYAKPSWQTGVPGIPADGKRDVPDVSFFASNGMWHSAYLMCVSANGATCVSSRTITTKPSSQEVGGTSVGTPAMAGVMALINQKAGSTQGLPNSALYTLAASQTYASCSAETGTASSACYFNDIDTGNIATPCDNGLSGATLSPNCTVTNNANAVGILSGYTAGVGFDLATGLGSLNVANVVNHWPSTIGAGATTVTVAPALNTLNRNQALSVIVTVASSPAGGATPTGTVILSGGGYTSAAATLASGSATINIPADSLTSGSDTLTATYSGNATYASKTGTASVTVTLLTPVVTATPSLTTLTTNQPLTVSGTVTGSGGTPTGTVTLTGGGYTSTAQALATGAYSFTIPAGSLAVGADVLTAAYSGDATYASKTGTATVTVTATLIPTVTVAASATLNSGASLTVTATVAGTGATPTGTVTLSGGGYTSTAQTLNASGIFVFTVPANSLSAGADVLTVSYSGDAVYSAKTGTTTVTVTKSTFTLAASAPTAIGTPGGTTTSTVTVTGVASYTGTVTLACALTTSPTGAQFPPNCSAGSGTVTLSSTATTGTTTVMVSTTPAISELIVPRLGNGKGWVGAGGGAILAFLMFFGIPARRRSWRSMLGVLVVMAALGSLAGCGGGGGGGTKSSGTTLGNYTFTVTGTGSPSITPVPTTTFTVTVN